MEQDFDSLAAYRKLEESGMPEPQADATVEVVNNAMQNFVTKEYFTAELDRRFSEVDQRFSEVDQRLTKLDAKIDTGFAEMGRRQAWGFVYMSAFFIGLATLFLTAQPYFNGQAEAAPPDYYSEPAPPPPDPLPTEPANESPC